MSKWRLMLDGLAVTRWISKRVRGNKKQHSGNADDITLTTDISLEEGEGRTDR